MLRTALLVAASLVAFAPTAATAAPAPGSGSAGDPYFPRQGNGGYNARAYSIALRYRPSDHHLLGRATVRASATQDLSRFDLDLRRRMHVSSVRVDGTSARFAQPARKVQELVITPKRPLARGSRFTVAVRYAGTAGPVHDPDGSLDGWIPTRDGAFVADEPQGAPTWFPVNDTPRDKARYTVSVTIPRRLAAVSNGSLRSVTGAGRHRTWTWHLARPVSSYLVTATIGRFDLRFGRTARGIPYTIAVDPSEARKAHRVLGELPRIVDFYSSVYGRYPFGSAGAIVDHAHRVGYALETATRPVFDRAPDQATLAHELAHQWYGDTVTLKRWRDIWLNEGFAEFSSWLWDEHHGGRTAAQHLAELMRQPAESGVWNPPPGDPGSAKRIFSGSVYDRGAGTLEALRQKLGDRTFFTIMRGWLRDHRYGNATVPQFTAYAESVSGRNLSHFFRIWLYRAGKP